MNNKYSNALVSARIYRASEVRFAVSSIHIWSLDSIDRAIQLPVVIPAIRRLQAVTFDVDEYNIKARLKSLVDRWA